MTRPLKHGSKVCHDVYGSGSVRHCYDPETVAVFFFERNEELVVAASELQRRHRLIPGERRQKPAKRKKYYVSLGMFFPSLYTPADTRPHNDCQKCGRCLIGYGPGVQHSCDGGRKPSAVIRALFQSAAVPPAQSASHRGDPLANVSRRVHGFLKADYQILKAQVGDDAAQWGFQERLPRRPKSRQSAPAWVFDSAKLQILYRKLATGGRGKDRDADAKQAMMVLHMFHRMGLSAGEIGKEMGVPRARVDKIIWNVTTRGDKLFGEKPAAIDAGGFPSIGTTVASNEGAAIPAALLPPNTAAASGATPL